MEQITQIAVQLNQLNFEYDVYSLIRAFYPQSEVAVSKEAPSKDAQLAVSIFCETAQIRAVVSGPAPDRAGEGGGKNRAGEGRKEAEEKKQGTAEQKCTPCASESISCASEGDRSTKAQMLPGNGLWVQEAALPVEAGMERPQIKSVLKRVLYALLKERTGRDLPWGNLTGIRPVKLAVKCLEEGRSNAQTARFLREQYFVSPPKSALAISIANRERALLGSFPYQDGYSLYIGIPFCPSICLYCSFSSSPLALWKDKVDSYLDALEKEMEGSAGVFAPRQLQTVYIGGGTPTTLEPDQLDRLLCMTKRCFDLSAVREFTVEAGRPDTITREKLAVLMDHGISRISINPQTMNQETLDLIGRGHTVQEIEDTFHLARELGFDNINMDLIVGLPGEGEAQVLRTMEAVGRLDPDSVTVHALALKRAARLSRLFAEYKDISFQASDAVMDLTTRHSEARGLMPYYLYRQKDMAGNFENVGYAKSGKECLYNILIMEEVQSILALGAGGSTKIVYGDGHIERVENVKDIRSYIDRTEEMIARKQSVRL